MAPVSGDLALATCSHGRHRCDCIINRDSIVPVWHDLRAAIGRHWLDDGVASALFSLAGGRARSRLTGSQRPDRRCSACRLDQHGRDDPIDHLRSAVSCASMRCPAVSSCWARRRTSTRLAPACAPVTRRPKFEPVLPLADTLSLPLRPQQGIRAVVLASPLPADLAEALLDWKLRGTRVLSRASFGRLPSPYRFGRH